MVSIAGRARRGRRCSFRATVLLAASLAVAGPAAAAPDPHLAQLRPTTLMGRWSCSGTDAVGKPLSATLEWAFNDDGAFYFIATPKPAAPAHPRVAETWVYESDAGENDWRAVPDAGSADPAQWVSDGWRGSTLIFIREAAQSTMSRTFASTGPNQLTFGQQNQAGPAFRLRCVRTRNDAPK
jgi:hypothetical protein